MDNNNENKFLVQDKEMERKYAVEEEIAKDKLKEEEKLKKPKKKKFRVVTDIIFFIVFFIILLEAAVGFINMQKIKNEEDPVWYLSTKKVQKDNKTETIWNLGLYKIVKTDSAKNTTIQLLPFFIGE